MYDHDEAMLVAYLYRKERAEGDILCGAAHPALDEDGYDRRPDCWPDPATEPWLFVEEATTDEADQPTTDGDTASPAAR